jgi:hypothetical protein
MNRFPKAEKILLGFGALVFIISTYLFIFETDRIGQMLGLGSGSTRQIVARVESFQDMARRKGIDSPVFQPVIEKQNIFNQDTIMTGTNSGMVISFLSGDVVELGPDTLVQIEAKNPGADPDKFEFMLNVQKGVLTGKSVTQNIQVQEKGETVALKPMVEKVVAPTPAPAAVAQSVAPNSAAPVAAIAPVVAQATPIPVCRLGTNQLSAPDQASIAHATPKSKRGEARARPAPPRPKILVEVICDAGLSTADMIVKNKKGETLQALAIDIGPDHHGKFEFFANTPDTYQIEMKDFPQETVTVEVPANFETLEWATPGLRCDYGVAWKPLPHLGKKYGLYNEQGKAIKESSDLTLDHFALLEKILKLPKKVYLQLSLSSGFALRTPVLPIAAWRSCPVLRYPGDELKRPLSLKIPLLFTWSLIGHSDHFLFQVASDRKFKTIIFETKVDQNLERYNPKRKGKFYWRVQELRTHTTSDVYEFTLE